MTPLQLFFIGLPLLLIVVAAGITVARQRGEAELSRLDLFFGWVVIYSAFGTLLGMVGTMVVFFSYGAIPGTALDGGIINGQYYFSYKDMTYTPVSKQTWEVANFLELLATRTLWVAFAVLMVSSGYCYFRSRALK